MKVIYLCSLSALLWTGFVIEESLHRKRFHEYMEANVIEYSDLGCQIGWDATALINSQWSYVMTMEWDD